MTGKLELVRKWKFSECAVDVAPDILEGADVATWLKSKYFRGCVFGQDHLMSSNVYKLSGWCFLFNMPRFLVKQYGNWHEYCAPNKTLLRQTLYGRIDRIVAIS